MIIRTYKCDEKDCAVVFTVSSEDEKYMSCCPVCECGFTEIKARQPCYFGAPPELQHVMNLHVLKEDIQQAVNRGFDKVFRNRKDQG